MPRHQQDRNQFTLDFGEASAALTPLTPMSPEHAAIVHAHLPPPILPPIVSRVAGETTIRESNGSSESPNLTCDLPVPEPLRSAIANGVFGTDDFGEPVVPSEDEVHEISLQHGERLAELFVSLGSVNEALRANITSGRAVAIRDQERLGCQIQGMLARYAEDFGETAARHLESWARREASRRDFNADSPDPSGAWDASEQTEPQYGPGHPWHYLSRGDGQSPMAVGEIPPSPSDGRFVGKLPKDTVKRRAKLSQLFADQSRQLDDDKTRYNDIVIRGAVALSEYDRSIAYGGDDELAVASSLALKFNHISNGLGRVEWLRGKLGLQRECTPKN